MYNARQLFETSEKLDDPPPSLALRPSESEKDAASARLRLKVRDETSWNDWKWQMRSRIRNVASLLNYFPNLQDKLSIAGIIKKYPLAITPYYASLIHRLDNSDPVYAMSVPQLEELNNPAFLSEDPLEENEDMPVPGLVHRYGDRALLMATTTCSSYCRHCTRKRVAGTREVIISPQRLAQSVAYLKEHPEIHDVIISGGDPLTMPTAALEQILIGLRSVETVQIVRIGTRVPVVLPMRITDELTSMLKRYHPLWINTHFNHPNELTEEAAEACAKLADAGIPLGNQSVLLKGINDSPKIMEELCRGLVSMRVRPYYMYQCDLVRGVEHFRTPLSRGIEIVEYLRGRLSGLAIPTFVVDAPYGGGKIPVTPNYIISMSPTHTVLRNFEGMMVNYPEPGVDIKPQPQNGCEQNVGVWELVSGKASSLQPAKTGRGLRRQKIVEKRKSSQKPFENALFEL